MSTVHSRHLIFSRKRKSSSLHRCRPTTWNHQTELLIAPLKQQQSSCRYNGAPWLMEFATSAQQCLEFCSLCYWQPGKREDRPRIGIDIGWNLDRNSAAFRLRWTRPVCDRRSRNSTMPAIRSCSSPTLVTTNEWMRVRVALSLHDGLVYVLFVSGAAGKNTNESCAASVQIHL